MKSYVVTVTLNPAIDKTVIIDKLQIGGLNRVQSVRMDPGGKGINVARVLHQFEIPVYAAGVIAGIQGQNLLQYLNKEGIKTDFLTVPGETRTNLKVVEASSNITTEINEPGFSVESSDMEAFIQRLYGLLQDASYLVLGGSLPKQVDASIYQELMKISGKLGVRVILDADGEALLQGIQAVPYAIKPNLHELERLAGRKLTSDREILQEARKLLEQGIAIIIVSMGAQGAIVMDKKEAYRVRTAPIVPKSTVGAGDSMVAVLVYCLINRYSLAQTAEWITAAGTVTASKPGTQVCSLPEVRQFLSYVQAEQVNGDLH